MAAAVKEEGRGGERRGRGGGSLSRNRRLRVPIRPVGSVQSD